MKCINCYREIDEHLKFCTYCGAKQPLDRAAYEREHPELADALSEEEQQELERRQQIEEAELKTMEDIERRMQEEIERRVKVEFERRAQEKGLASANLAKTAIAQKSLEVTKASKIPKVQKPAAVNPPLTGFRTHVKPKYQDKTNTVDTSERKPEAKKRILHILMLFAGIAIGAVLTFWVCSHWADTFFPIKENVEDQRGQNTVVKINDNEASADVEESKHTTPTDIQQRAQQKVTKTVEQQQPQRGQTQSLRQEQPREAGQQNGDRQSQHAVQHQQRNAQHQQRNAQHQQRNAQHQQNQSKSNQTAKSNNQQTPSQGKQQAQQGNANPPQGNAPIKTQGNANPHHGNANQENNATGYGVMGPR